MKRCASAESIRKAKCVLQPRERATKGNCSSHRGCDFDCPALSMHVWFQDMKGNVGDIANHPAVMRFGCYVKYRAWNQIEILAILILNSTMARQYSACMRRMAKTGSNDWSVVNRPFPSRLISGTAKRDAIKVDDFKASKGKFTNFVWHPEGFEQGFRHCFPPSIGPPLRTE